MALSETELAVPAESYWLRRGLGTLIALLLTGGVVAAALVPSSPNLRVDSSPAAINRAAEMTKTAKTIRTDGTVSIRGPGGQFKLRVQSATIANDRSRFIMDFSGTSIRFPHHLEMLGTPGQFLLRQPDTDRWMSADSAELASVTARLGANQSAFLDYLGALAGQAHSAGSQRIRGVLAQRFDIAIDPARIPTVSDQQRASAEGLRAAGVTRIPGSVWLDAAGRLVRLEVHLGTHGVSTKSTTDFYAYGAPLTIDLPDPSRVQQVGTVAAMFAELGIPYSAPTPTP